MLNVVKNLFSIHNFRAMLSENDYNITKYQMEFSNLTYLQHFSLQSFKSNDQVEESLPAWMKEAVEKENNPTSSASASDDDDGDNESPKHSLLSDHSCGDNDDDDEEQKAMEVGNALNDERVFVNR